MVQGMLAVVVFCMFGFCFYIANKIDQFFDAIQETVKDKPERNCFWTLFQIMTY